MTYGDERRYMALVSNSQVQVEGVGEVGAIDVGLINIFKRVSTLVKAIISSEGDAFKTEILEGAENGRLVAKKPGRLLLKILKVSIPNDSEFNSLYVVEPYVEMAVKQIMQFDLYQLCLTLFHVRLIEEAQRLKDHFNKCVEVIREEARSKAFKAKVNSYQRSSNKNFKELIEYIDALFVRYSRLMVVRLDLSYSKENCDVTQADAARDRKRLFENARSNNMFANMVGWVWKLEHGPKKGFHYHMLFFFDGSKVRRDIVMATMIGRYWVDVITKGRGLYYNCNSGGFYYKSCGVGMVSHSDEQAREGLRNVALYLTKTDLFMKLRAGGRCIGKMNRPANKDPRGRPRALSCLAGNCEIVSESV